MNTRVNGRRWRVLDEAESGPGTRSLQRLRSRQRLLDIAVERLAARGTAGISVQDVAARAGFTTGAVYHQFSSREELVEAATAYAMANYPSLDDVVQAARSVREFLVSAAEISVSLIDDEHGPFRDLLRVQMHLILASPNDENARHAVRTFLDDQAVRLAARIADTATKNDEVLSVAPDVIAREYLALLRGFVLVRLADASLYDKQSILAAVARMADSVTALDAARQ
jgi:AcrR family transcriptional regulator